jgi:hypothetical protein
MLPWNTRSGVGLAQALVTLQDINQLVGVISARLIMTEGCVWDEVEYWLEGWINKDGVELWSHCLTVKPQMRPIRDDFNNYYL